MFLKSYIEEVTVSSVEASPYLADSSGYRGWAEQVFLPANVAELRQIVVQSNAKRVPLTVAGAGTGLAGARAPHGGWVVSLERFRQIEITAGRARCGAGVSLGELHKSAAKNRQFFGPNPTEESASIGGIISTNAGGARSFHYGSVRRHVLALEVTFMNGRTERFERGQKVDFATTAIRLPETTKNAAGYYLAPDLEWVDLLAGSEGTLGIITEAELQLLPEPAALLSGVVFFPAEDLALNAVTAWRAVNELRLLEFMDGNALKLLRPRYPDVPEQAGAALLIEQNLDSEDDEEAEAWTRRLAEQGAFEEESWFGFRAGDRERFRGFRHTLPTIVVDTARRNGSHKFGTDFAVPLRFERDLYGYYKQTCEQVMAGEYTIFGHAGDANNHVNLLPATSELAEKGAGMIHDFARFVVAHGGTVAAEHGVGKNKIDLLKLMYADKEIDAMRNVKRHLDPLWLLGQDTIFEHS